MSLGNEIRQTRQKCLLTQEDFAKILSVAVSTVNRWEMDKAKPNMKAMKQIKQFCENNNVPYNEIEKAWLETSRKDR